MKCLCCGKTINVSNQYQWHKSCIKKFFGSNVIPDILIDDEEILKIASDATNIGVTVPGVQKKLSINVISKNSQLRLTMASYPSGYIFKPQVDKYPYLCESEQLLMNMAELIKIPTVPHALVKYNNKLGYITKRIDRVLNNNQIKKIAMEDFCQLANRLTEDKYKSSYEKCTSIIKKYSYYKKIDLVDFYIRILFSFISGNNDMHLKNFSLIYDESLQGYKLSPQYDLVPALIFIDDKDELALTLNGKTRNITKNDFIKFGEHCELNKKQCLKIFDQIKSKQDDLISLVKESYISDSLKNSLINLINERISRF